jgi:hypothetical protein
MKFFRWLWSKFRPSAIPRDNYVASADAFLEIDIEKVAADLELDKLAEMQGRENLPKPDSVTLDEVEQRVVNQFLAEQRQHRDYIARAVQAYLDRAKLLNFENDFNSLSNAAGDAKCPSGDFGGRLSRLDERGT